MVKINPETKEKHELPVNKEMIEKGLREGGLEQGDIAFVHSSLSSFGHVHGGADAVIDALLETLGDSGTLVLPTFTWGDFHDRSNVTFDLLNAACETGVIPETFRKRDQVMRSRHICHSVAALGPDAQRVMGEGIRSFGKGSTFDQLYRLNSWNLFLGVSFEVCTALHMAEEFMQVPYRAYRDFRNSTVVLDDGTEMSSESVEFLRREGFENSFAKMERIMSEAGLLRSCKVGQATKINARIRDIFDIATDRLRKDIYFFSTRAPEDRVG